MAVARAMRPCALSGRNRWAHQPNYEPAEVPPPARLPPGPATLAIRTGAPLLPVGCYFKDGGYRVVIGEALALPATGSRSEKVVALTQALASELESIIAVAPRQWHLVQPNWPSDREPGA